MIFSFVEKVDSPIGDENDLDDEALVQDFGVEKVDSPIGDENVVLVFQVFLLFHVEKVDSPIGDENAFAKLLLSSPFCV